MTLRSWLSAALGEPLFHFCLAGIVIFAGHTAWVSATDLERTTIVISGDHTEQLIASATNGSGEPPSPDAVGKLIGQYAQSEALYREAIRLGLDDGDDVVRAHLIEQMRFLIEDRNPPMAPDEAAMREAYNQNPAAFTVPAMVSFRHIPFLPAADGTSREDEILRIRQSIVESEDSFDVWMNYGDPFALSREVDLQSQTDLARLLGPEFADAVFQLEPGRVSGPIASRVAQHLVIVDKKTEASVPPFEAIRDQVNRVVMDERWERANRAALDELMENYRIVLDDRP
ncbi:MAG: peptidylprolyl isomerase [Pseudomonadota bacterium]